MYEEIVFPVLRDRPWVYANFVATIDGKVGMGKKTEAYWPLESRQDHEALKNLRVQADVLVQGKHTAKQAGALRRLADPAFQQRRRERGKSELLPYVIASHLKVHDFLEDCWRKGYRQVLVEGGPTLLRSFVEADRLDELFLTIAPILVGGEDEEIKTVLGGSLFPAHDIKRAQLVSCQVVEHEVFLRYRFTQV